MSDTEDTPDTTQDENLMDLVDDSQDDPAEVQSSERGATAPPGSPKKPKKRLKRMLITLTVLMVLGALSILVLPIGLRFGAEYWLRAQGQSNADIGDIDLNLFTGRIVIKTLDTTGTAGDALTMSEAEIKIRWGDLFDKRIYIEKFTLSDVALDVVITEDGALIIGGLPIPVSEAPVDSDSEPWGIGLGGIELSNVTIRYSDPVIQEDLLVESISFGEATSWQPDVETSLVAKLSLNGGLIAIQGDVSPFREAPKFAMNTTINTLALKFLNPILSSQGIEHLDSTLSAQLSIAGEVAPLQNTITLETKGEFTLDGIILAMDPIKIEQGALKWKGTTILRGDISSPSIHIEGTTYVSDANVLFKLDQYRIEHQAIGWDGTVDFQQGEIPTLKLKGNVDAKGFNFSDKENPVLVIAAETYSVHDTDIAIDLNTLAIQGTHSIQFTQADLNLNYLGAGAIETNAEWKGKIHFWDTVKTTVDTDTAIVLREVSIVENDLESTQLSFAELTVNSKAFHLHATPSDKTLEVNGVLDVSKTSIVPVDSPYTITQEGIQWEGNLASNEAGDLRIDGDVHAQTTTVTEGTNGRYIAL